MKKLHIIQLFQNKKIKKGFTLIEFILVMAICSIVILPLYSVFNISCNTFKASKETDELLVNAKHSIQYIKRDIKSADMLIPNYKIKQLSHKYPTSIGFVIVTIERRTNPQKSNELVDVYNYVTYYTKNQKIIRIAYEDKGFVYPSKDSFKGHNEISRMVDTIENTSLDIENSMVHLDFNFKSSFDKGQSVNIKSDVYVWCEIDY